MGARRRCILVCEDSPTQAEHTRLVLEEADYLVEVARNGREALEKLDSVKPDLIISDVVMPDMDGFALCKAVKADQSRRRIPFVLLTSQRTPMDVIRGLELGADNFITKPFEDSHLLGRVSRIFENLEHRKRGGLDMEVSVRLGGREIVVNADKQQMIELLFSLSEELSDSNRGLEQARLALEEQARDLERQVEARTRELREAREKYRSLVEQVPAVIYLVAHEPAGHVLFVSPQVESLLGSSVYELMADPELWSGRIHPGDRERVEAELERLRPGSAPARMEYRICSRQGRELWVRDEVRVVGTDSGVALQGVLVDITERRRTEEALVEEQRLKSAVLDSITAAIVACDSRGVLTLFNRAAIELSGADPGPLPVERWTERCDVFLPDGYTPLKIEELPLYRALNGEHVQEMEIVVQVKERSPRTMLANGRAIMNSQGGRAGAVIAMEDVTERKQAEAQLRQAQKMEAVGQLAGGVAHDFNNLLTVITGYSELLRADLGTTRPGASSGSTQIRKAADSAAALTRQLLAFSRKQVLQPVVLDLNAVVAEVREDAPPAHRRAHPGRHRLGARARPCQGGPRAARAGAHQPRGQRPRRDADGRQADHRDRQRRAGRALHAQPSRRAARATTSCSR